MPELPEITVYAQNLADALCGKRAEEAKSYHKRAAEPDFLPAVLREVRPEGKETVFVFDSGALTVHLMLTGGFYLADAAGYADVKNKIFSLRFEGGAYLIVADPNYYASVQLGESGKDAPIPLTEWFSEHYFLDLLRRKPRSNIKTLLLDQQNIRGIGNAYADEILYLAGISPLSLAGKIPDERRRALYAAVNDALKRAILEIRRALPGAIRGEYRDFLHVHKKGSRVTDTGEEVLVTEIGSRKTYYTAAQVLYR